jgi:hypothetical protein
MAKEEKKQTVSSADGNKINEKSANDNQVTATAEIETVDDLEACYPQLVTEIRDKILEEIENCPVKQLKENMSGLYERIVADIQNKSGPNMNVPGFLLEAGDPFAAGTLHTYQGLKKVDGLRLPFVLPYKDKATKAALGSYIMRAEGGGDFKRAEAAKKAMGNIK